MACLRGVETCRARPPVPPGPATAGFDAGAAAAVREILAADIARGSDIGAAADAQGLSHTDPAIVALREQSDQQRTRELAELLGPAGFAAYERFQRAIPVRGFVDGLAEQLAWTAPLSGRQADELEQALADSSEAYRSGKAADPKTVEWERVDRAAERILSPGQLAVWQQGTAHNRFGGSRRDQELETVYRRAVQRMQDAATAAVRE